MNLLKILSFGTLKGGVGKTQMVFNLAGILAEMGKKVLVFDNDPQANSTSDFNIDETAEGFIGAEEIFEDQTFDIHKVIVKAPIPELPNLDIIPCSIALTRTEMRIINLAGREFLLKNYFKRNKEVFNQYDYILFDTNPSMSVINQNAFLLSDALILVSEVGMNSLKGAELLMALWEEILERLDLENNIKAFIVNKFRKNVKLHSEYLEFCKEHEEIGSILMDTVIPLNSKLNESELENKPINIFDSSSIGGQAYKELADELLAKGVL